jgi:putative membrane protein
MRRRERQQRVAWRGVLAGLVGGLIAAGAMSLAHNALAEKKTPAEAGDDATVKTADAIMRTVLGQPLPENKKSLAGTLVHYAFGGVMGALYGGVAEVAPRIVTGFGLPFGAAVWLGAHVLTVPALGLAEPATRQPLSKEAPELGLHLLYGAVTEPVRRLLRGRF